MRLVEWKKKIAKRKKDVRLLWEARKYSSLREVYVNMSGINNGEKDVRLIAKQGKGNLTLMYGYKSLFIAYWIVKDDVIA